MGTSRSRSKEEQAMMNRSRAIATAASLLLTAIPAENVLAGTLHNGWNYAIDSFSDGVSGLIIGPAGPFEFYSMALKETEDDLFLALNANLPITGTANAQATNGSISWGDLFFNVSGQDFKTASEAGNLFAVRFAANNDSSVSELGVYRNVSAKNVTQTNVGFMNLQQYDTTVINGGGTPSMADLASNDPYLEYTGAWNILNSIAGGTKIGDIEFLSNSDLAMQNLDFAQFSAVGTHTIGVRFDRNLLPSGDFIAHVLAECANDGMALTGTLQSHTNNGTNVPEPSTILGLLSFGLLFVAKKV